MGDLYFITRCGALHSLGVWMGFISVFTFIILNAVAITTDDWDGEDCFSEKVKTNLRKFAKTFLVTSVIGVILAVLVPTKDEAYVIYGVGSTIDYVKSSDKAKELPDKAINALDRWLESISDDSKD